MIENKFKILHEFGLHAKLATKLVNLTNTFSSDIKLSFNKITVNAKSIMGVMSLGITNGDTITLTYNGNDEKEASEQIALFFITDNVAKQL